MSGEDEATVLAFVVPNRRDRWLSGLARPKRRQATTKRLHAPLDLDNRYMHPVEGAVQEAQAELVRLGAPARCHVIGGSLDGQAADLGEALRVAKQDDGGVLISCVSGLLAAYLAEAPSKFIILRRADRVGYRFNGR